MKALLRRFLDDDQGATAIEYGLMAALICIVLIAAFSVFTGSVAGVFGAATGKLIAAIG